jgi:hypothetical protein
LLAWVTAERARLVHALLTIARASVVRDVVLPTLPTIGGFTDWVTVMGRAVALDSTVGAHFLGNIEQMWEAEDTEAGEWEAFLDAWHAHFGDREVGVSDVHTAARWDLDSPLFCQSLYDALPGDVAQALEKDKAFAVKLGTALREHRETRYGGDGAVYRLVRAGADKHAKAARWCVVREGGERHA